MIHLYTASNIEGNRTPKPVSCADTCTTACVQLSNWSGLYFLPCTDTPGVIVPETLCYCKALLSEWSSLHWSKTVDRHSNLIMFSQVHIQCRRSDTQTYTSWTLACPHTHSHTHIFLEIVQHHMKLLPTSHQIKQNRTFPPPPHYWDKTGEGGGVTK